MTLKQLTDDESLALNGTTDERTGLQYPRLLQSRWAEAILRGLHRLLDVGVPDLRVLEVDGNADAIAVLAGTAQFDGVIYPYAGETGDNGAIDGLADNTTHRVYAYLSGGALAVDASGSWPSFTHIKLARVVMSDGTIEEIEDLRAAHMLSAAAAITTATTGKRGTVLKAAAVADIADPATASAEDCADKINDLLASLRAAGLLSE